MDEQTREFYAQLLYQAAMGHFHSGVGTVVLNVAAQMCTHDTIYAKFMKDVHERRERCKMLKKV